MKTAIVTLYVLLTVQSCCVVFGFMISYAVTIKTMELAFVEAGKSIGENLIKVCDQRYVQK